MWHLPIPLFLSICTLVLSLHFSLLGYFPTYIHSTLQEHSTKALPALPLSPIFIPHERPVLLPCHGAFSVLGHAPCPFFSTFCLLPRPLPQKDKGRCTSSRVSLSFSLSLITGRVGVGGGGARLCLLTQRLAKILCCPDSRPRMTRSGQSRHEPG